MPLPPCGSGELQTMPILADFLKSKTFFLIMILNNNTIYVFMTPNPHLESPQKRKQRKSLHKKHQFTETLKKHVWSQYYGRRTTSVGVILGPIYLTLKIYLATRYCHNDLWYLDHAVIWSSITKIIYLFSNSLLVYPKKYFILPPNISFPHTYKIFLLCF